MLEDKNQLQAMRSKPGLKLVRTYFALSKSCNGYFYMLDEDGEKIPVIGQGGRHEYVGIKPQFREAEFKFACVQASHKAGHKCVFHVYNDTPQELIDALEEKRLNCSSSVWFEDQIIAKEDPTRYAEMKKNKAMKNKLELAVEKASNATQEVKNIKEQTQATILSMQKKLDKAEAEINKGKK